MDAVLQALADQSRRTVLEILRDHPATAGELAEALPIARPGVSRHLRVLREAGLVDVRQEAQRRIYSLRPEALVEVDEWLEEYRALWQNRLDALHTEIARGKKAQKMRTIGTMRALDETRGAVRVEDVYDTDIEDLWEACTTPERLARWIAEVSGDLREGGTVQAVFTSTWSGPARIEVCDAPHHLLLTTEPGTDDESQIEAWLTAEGPGPGWWSRSAACRSTRCTSTEPAGRSTSRTSAVRSRATAPRTPDGWSEQTPAPAWHARWTELTPAYQDTAVG